MERLRVVKPPPYGVASVDSALQVLLMMQEQDGVGVTEVAARIGATPSTAHRILSTLVYRGFAEQGPRRRYFLGPVMREGGRTPDQLVVVVRPAQARLRDATGGTCSAMVREGTLARIVSSAAPTRGDRVTDRAGTTLPLESSAGGRSLLAHLSRSELHHLYTGRRAALEGSQLTPARLAELEEELDRVRVSGVAYNIGLTEVDLAAVGMAVPSPGRDPWLSVAIAVPRARAAATTDPRWHAALREAVTTIGEGLRARGLDHFAD